MIGYSHQKASSPVSVLKNVMFQSLEDDKAMDVVEIDLAGKTDIADCMLIATGRSSRHVAAIAQHLLQKAKDAGFEGVTVEGLPQAEWVLLDAKDVIVHIFKPDVREHYNLEKMWSVPVPSQA